MTGAFASVSFRLDVLAEPKARARFTRKGIFTPKKTRGFEKLVRDTFALKCGREWDVHGAYALDLEFHLPDYKTRDLDNLCKGCADALNGLAYVDDNQVVSLRARKVYKLAAAAPFVTVTVTRLGDWPVKRKRKAVANG